MVNWEYALQVNVIAIGEAERDQIYNYLKTKIESEKAAGKLARPARLIKTSREVNESYSVQEEI